MPTDVTHWKSDESGWMAWYPRPALNGTPSVEKVEPDDWRFIEGRSFRFVRDRSDLSDRASKALRDPERQPGSLRKGNPQRRLRAWWNKQPRRSKNALVFGAFAVLMWWVS
jgi:hypothetical protein